MADVDVINAMVNGWELAEIPRKQELCTSFEVLIDGCFMSVYLLCCFPLYNLRQDTFVKVDDIKITAADYSMKEDAMQKNLYILQKHFACKGVINQ